MQLAPLGPHRQIYLPPPSPCSTFTTSFASCFEDRPVLPPRSPVPPLRPSKHNPPARTTQPQVRSSSISLADEEDTPPQIPPRDHAFSQPGSRSSSPLPLVPPPSSSSLVSLPPPPLSVSPRRTSGLLGSLLSSNSSPPSRLAAPGSSSSYSSSSLLDPLSFRDGRGLSSLIDSSPPAPLPERPAFLERYGAANMAAVKPMMQQQPGGGAKTNSSYNNNNNGQTAVPSMQQEQSVSQVQGSVHGVTLEECKAALQCHNWRIPQAINYLKVEQLFRLGLRSRAECEELLQRRQWNLEQASTVMLDAYGPHQNRIRLMTFSYRRKKTKTLLFDVRQIKKSNRWDLNWKDRSASGEPEHSVSNDALLTCHVPLGIREFTSSNALATKTFMMHRSIFKSSLCPSISAVLNVGDVETLGDVSPVRPCFLKIHIQQLFPKFGV
ncbi:hypothetical protein F2P81_019554 [Scophthalmus maximus]|uniref:UBA domain-containing protein n=1 Tax=Scophthalmus maximus TaxID=52904 RepID=A0A6A4S5Y9_SCOMX|nr:hypothetical protein F2P81_019554 [Scophthalmus maximus]